MELKLQLDYWKKGMKIKCPVCNAKVRQPYVCKCGIILKPFVKIGV